MHYVGIDIAKRTHKLAIRDGEGKPLGGAHTITNDQKGFENLSRILDDAGVRADDAIVAMEATGHYWMALFSYLDEKGFSVAVVNPVLIDAFRKADTLRKTKTDAVDAFLIAEYARFKKLEPSVISPEDADGLKQLTRYRMHLVKERTSLKNRANSIADRLFPELDGLFKSKGSATAQAILGRFGTPAKVGSTDIRTLTRVIQEASHGHHGREKAKEVKAAARASVGSSFATDALAYEVGHIFSLVDHLDSVIADLDEKIEEIIDDEAAKIIRSIPGVGQVTSAIIIAEIGDPNRFETPEKLRAFSGIDASVVQSGAFNGTEQHMSKRGSSYLRYAIMTAASKAIFFDPYFGDYYDSMIARGKHHYVAVSGVARKLCGVILALWKEGRLYEPRPSIQSMEGDA